MGGSGAAIVLRPGLREVTDGHLAQMAAAFFFAGSYLFAKRLTGMAGAGQVVATPFPKFFNAGEKRGDIPALSFEAFEKLDGSLIVISNHRDRGSEMFLLPASGGEPRLISPDAPSWWHGWSPDGKELAYCGDRDGVFDIYTISTNGGAERRLTNGEGHNDGPDYTPDGQWIYFNSSRTGTMQIWRMRIDGSDLQQLTSDGYGDWFPHPSPDGKKVLFLSYDADVEGHPRDKQVRLRLMDADGGNVETLFEFFGGQGSINVPNWSPDGTEFAFVRYAPAT